MGQETLPEVGTGREVLHKVWDRSWDPPKGLGWVGGPSRMSGACQGTLLEVRNETGDPPRGPGWVGGLSRRSGTGRDFLWKVQEGLGGPP